MRFHVRMWPGPVTCSTTMLLLDVNSPTTGTGCVISMPDFVNRLWLPELTMFEKIVHVEYALCRRSVVWRILIGDCWMMLFGDETVQVNHVKLVSGCTVADG